MTYNLIFCVFVAIGCAVKLDAVIEFSDAMLFAMGFANIIGIVWMAPIVREEVRAYWQRMDAKSEAS